MNSANHGIIISKAPEHNVGLVQIAELGQDKGKGGHPPRPSSIPRGRPRLFGVVVQDSADKLSISRPVPCIGEGTDPALAAWENLSSLQQLPSLYWTWLTISLALLKLSTIC